MTHTLMQGLGIPSDTTQPMRLMTQDSHLTTSMQSQTPSCPRCRYWLTAALVVLVSGAAAAQQRTLTIGDIYDPSTRENFSGRVPANISWIDGTHYALPRDAAGGVAWVSVDAAAGSERPLYDPAKMEAALAKLPGVAANDARRLARSRGLI